MKDLLIKGKRRVKRIKSSSLQKVRPPRSAASSSRRMGFEEGHQAMTRKRVLDFFCSGIICSETQGSVRSDVPGRLGEGDARSDAS